MKKYLLLLLPVMFLAGCTADSDLSRKTEVLMQEANAQIGMPTIKNFQEKKLMKQIYEMRDSEKLITYVYLFDELNGKLVFLGKAIGFGLPYATQFTSPETYYDRRPQAEPNGLFMPSQAEATWVVLLDSSGNPRPVYIEPRVLISPFPLQ
jgi:hypothetical protein